MRSAIVIRWGKAAKLSRLAGANGVRDYLSRLLASKSKRTIISSALNESGTLLLCPSRLPE